MRSAGRTPRHPISGEASEIRRRSFWIQRSTPHNSGHRIITLDRDRGTPHGATPPTPPGIRVTYLGGSIELCRDGNIKTGEAD
jgi:hypothetical protein